MKTPSIRSIFPLALGLATLACSPTAFGQAGDRKDKDGDVQSEIWKTFDVPEAPILSPQQGLESIQIADGFRVELVASEPLIQDPVAIVWDEDSRLWVVEMPAYMPDVDGNNEDNPIGRVVVLEDTDSDGVMDKSTPFLEGLVTPRAISLVKGGVLVAEPPTLWFCEDLDGDLKSDRKTKVADYAVSGSVEHRENALMRGLDNWLYNAKSNRRLKWDGANILSEETASRGQWGMSMDDYGRLFYTSNSNPGLADFQPYEYSNRNPGYLSKAGVNVNVASDRRVFSNRVNPGVNRGYRGPTLREDYRLNTTTAVSGSAIYRGDKYPAEFYGNHFATEPSGNTVLRYTIEEDGFGFTAQKQVEDDPKWDKVDFIASTDERFRPVAASSGPDGFLYIVDMYRGILQHKVFVTTFLRKQILERGLDAPTGLGRIYRIVPNNAPERGDWPRLSEASDIELVRALGSQNGWVRDTAQRLLVDRKHLSAQSIKALGKAVGARNELKALHALWALEGRAALDPSTVARALSHDSEWVRVHAIRAGEPSLAGDSIDWELLAAYGARFKDPSFRVRLQAVQSLAVIRNEAMVLDQVQRIFHPDLPNPYMEDAIVSSLSGHELEFANRVLRNATWTRDDGREAVLGKLAGALFEKRETEQLERLVALVEKKGIENWKSAALIAGLSKTAGRPEARPIKIDRRPEAYYAFADSLLENPDFAGLAKAFIWPGKVSDNPLDNLNKKQLAFVDAGKEIYTATCMACHQPDGNGMAGLAPPLNGSDWVTGSKERLALMVHHGVSGPIEVAGEAWNSVMPGHGPMPQFQDEGLAQVLSYIRTAWGNKADIVADKEIRPAVEGQKKRFMPWTVDELEKLGY
ncbi:MAG: hypothetical protein CBD18_04140 [Opitutales bacterium TMED158]|nr:MAG: hypothetical protein CBD18_04140 [Opitutales bacterium TMED158]